MEGAQWMMDQHVVIREDKINSHGGNQRAGSQPVSERSHSAVAFPQGSWREKQRRKSENVFSELFSEQFTEQQWGVTLWPVFFWYVFVCVGLSAHARTQAHARPTLCCEGLHFNHVPSSVGDSLLLQITIDWWLACNPGNVDWEEGEVQKLGLENEMILVQFLVFVQACLTCRFLLHVIKGNLFWVVLRSQVF